MATITVVENNSPATVVVGPLTSVGTFRELTDTPISYVGNGGRILVTRQDELGLEFVPAYGTGDMTKATYDTNNTGVVDDSEALGGVPATNFAQTGDPVDSVKYIPQPIQPTHLEGQVWFCENAKSLNLQTRFTDVVLNLGFEQLMEVYNDTGVTIPNGSVVKQNGAISIPINAVIRNYPKIDLAIADNFTNAVVLGMATHDIAPGTTGYITTGGIVHGLDTSSLTVGVPLYLSSTVPGGITPTPPDIVTQIGGCIFSDALTGEIQVSIINTIVLPPIMAAFQFTSTPLAVTTTPTEFANFLESHSTLIDITSGNSFLLPVDGRYEVNFTVSLSNITASSSGHIIFIEVYNKTSASVAYTYNMVVGRSDTVSSCSFEIPLSFLTNDDISLRYWSNTAVGSAVVASGISMYITSRHIFRT